VYRGPVFFVVDSVLSLFDSLMFKRTDTVDFSKVQLFRWRSPKSDHSGTSGKYLKRLESNQSSWSKSRRLTTCRACFRSGEIHVLDSTGAAKRQSLNPAVFNISAFLELKSVGP